MPAALATVSARECAGGNVVDSGISGAVHRRYILPGTSPYLSLTAVVLLERLAMHRSRFCVAFQLLLCGAFCAASRLTAQTIDASILGTVRDTAGVALAGVAVTARNTTTACRRRSPRRPR